MQADSILLRRLCDSGNAFSIEFRWMTYVVRQGNLIRRNYEKSVYDFRYQFVLIKRFKEKSGSFFIQILIRQWNLGIVWTNLTGSTASTYIRKWLYASRSKCAHGSNALDDRVMDLFVHRTVQHSSVVIPPFWVAGRLLSLLKMSRLSVIFYELVGRIFGRLIRSNKEVDSPLH